MKSPIQVLQSTITLLIAVDVYFMMPAGVFSMSGPVSDAGQVCLDSIPSARFKFDGVLGQRVKANVENWLLVAPERNPGMLEVLAQRESNRFLNWERLGKEGLGDNNELPPFAGEYVGKYLISAVQAMRMSDDPRLRETVGKVVDRLIELQTEDGYLGCWPKKERLLKYWDLWGHYHAILGLILWYEQTGDEKAISAARKAADLVCNTYLDTGRRVIIAGSDEVNMAIIHGMAILYRKTGEPRYLRMAQKVLKDFEEAGDYYRQGLKGEEFFRTPRPRWESLHSLQGLAELYRITGDETFRRSFLNLWASMRRFDVHNTGAFSSGEVATGNPFVNEMSIETCCAIAWEAVMIDALRLSGDSTIADDLELATFNAVAGSQHPSGEWCTYNTPMNGTRTAFHRYVKWQGRPNAPFLGCCPVNGPRGFGMIGEWGVMHGDDGLAVNYYGPMRAEVALADGTPMVIEENTDYPIGDAVRLKVTPQAAKQFTLALRIPAWSTKTEVLLNGQPTSKAKPGEYLKLTRSWQAGDEIALRLDMRLRYESGDLEQVNQVSLYRGPILLCLDDRFKAEQPVAVDVAKLSEARPMPIDDSIAKAAGSYQPWLVLDLPADGKTLRLIDFASAGATGQGYQSWLPASGVRPPRPVAWQPVDGAKLGPGTIRFTWRKPADSALANRRHTIVISDSPTFERTIVRYGDQTGDALAIPREETAKLQPGVVYYWKIVARNEYGETESLRPYKQFVINPAVPQ